MTVDKFPFAFDPEQMQKMFKVPDFQSLFSGAQLPSGNVEAIMAAQKKNIDALIAMNKIAVAGYQEVFKHQAAQIEAAVSEARDRINAVQGQPLSVEQAEENLAVIRTAIEKAMTDARELAEIAQKTNTDAFDVIKARFDEAVGEFQTSGGKPGK